MEYRIEYAGGRCKNFAHSRKDLLAWLKILKDEEITDISKIYKNGLTETVMEKYEKYIVKKGSPSRIGGKNIEKETRSTVVDRNDRGEGDDRVGGADRRAGRRQTDIYRAGHAVRHMSGGDPVHVL